MELTIPEYFRWLLGFPPKNIASRLAPGEPPLPGLDRYGRALPPSWLVPFQKLMRSMSYSFDQWQRNGPTIDTRSPSFAFLVFIVFIVSMALPEFFTLFY